jgi:hypothetical protein
MRTSTQFFGLFAPSLLCFAVILAQTNPPPPDPHEIPRDFIRKYSSICSFACRCGTGWAADIALFGALGDMGTPTQSRQSENAIALRKIETD